MLGFIPWSSGNQVAFGRKPLNGRLSGHFLRGTHPGAGTLGRLGPALSWLALPMARPPPLETRLQASKWHRERGWHLRNVCLRSGCSDPPRSCFPETENSWRRPRDLACAWLSPPAPASGRPRSRLMKVLLVGLC